MLTRHSIIVDGTKVYYWMRNPHIEQTMLFVHGLKGNHKALTELSEYFSDYCTILVDLPGYGRSTSFLNQPHTVVNYATFLHRFILALNLNKVDLIGHSYGASISVVLAAMHPGLVDHLVLISPAVPHRSIGQTLARLQLGIGRQLPRAWRKMWLSSSILEIVSSLIAIKTVSNRRKLELMAKGIQTAKEQRPSVLLESLNSFLKTPLYSYAQRIAAPTLIIAGEADIISPLNTQHALAQHIPQVRVRLMPEVGHLAPMERPGSVGRIIGDAITHHPSQIPTHVHYPDLNDLILPSKPSQKFTQPKYR